MACSYPFLASCSAIYAGHFGVSLVDALVGAGDVGQCRLPEPSGAAPRETIAAAPRKARISCIINVRHPLERLISCHEFFLRKPGGPSFHSLTLRKQLRVVGECGGNTTVAYYGGGEYDPRGQHPLGHVVKLLPRGGSLERAMASINACVVGVVERWDESLRIFQEAFPWASFGTQSSRAQHMQRSSHGRMSSLRLSVQRVRSCTACGLL